MSDNKDPIDIYASDRVTKMKTNEMSGLTAILTLKEKW